MKELLINNIKISNKAPIVLIAGPCQIESMDHSLYIAGEIDKICKELGMQFIFKSSFDKANRSSINGKRGIGIEAALPIFKKIQESFPVLTDVHTIEQCEILKDVVDILQIPAFLSRQTDLLIAAGKTNKVINVKKGQFMAPGDMKNVVAKIKSTNNDKIMLTERGVCFGYHNLVNDMRGIEIMKRTGCPVVFDATHSVQQPSANSFSSGGQREFIKPLAKSATALGISALFIETHQDPDNAPSDSMSMLPISQLKDLLHDIIRFDKVAKSLR